MRNSGWLWELELSSEAAKEVLLAVVVQSVSVKHSTRLQASRIWSTASSRRARRSLDKETTRCNQIYMRGTHVLLYYYDYFSFITS